MSDSEEEFVRLISSDGFQFIVEKEVCLVSGTLRGMLQTSFQESETNTIKLHELDSILLGKVVEYLFYNYKYKDEVDVPDFNIPTEMALELLVAADFLDGMSLSSLFIPFTSNFTNKQSDCVNFRTNR